MNTDEKRLLIERYLDAYNRFDVEGMMDVVHANVTFTNVADGAVTASATGASEFRQLAEQAKAAFASRKQTMKAFEAEGDKASIEVAYEGVLATDLPNGMKAGERLRLEGRSHFVFRDGKIYRITDES